MQDDAQIPGVCPGRDASCWMSLKSLGKMLQVNVYQKNIGFEAWRFRSATRIISNLRQFLKRFWSVSFWQELGFQSCKREPGTWKAQGRELNPWKELNNFPFFCRRTVHAGIPKGLQASGVLDTCCLHFLLMMRRDFGAAQLWDFESII